MKAIAYFVVPAGLVVLLGLAPSNGPDVLTAEEACSIWGTGDCVTSKNGDWGCSGFGCTAVRNDVKDGDDGDDKIVSGKCKYEPAGSDDEIECGDVTAAFMCDD